MVDRFTPKSEPSSALPPDHPSPAPAEGEPKPSPSADSAIPSKFSGPEELAKAYRELEQKLSERDGPQKPTGDQGSPSQQGSEGPAGSEGQEGSEGAEGQEGSQGGLEIPQAAADAGLSLDTFTEFVEEYNEKGQLSDKSYEALEARGLNRDLVDSYIAGQHALAHRSIQAAYEVAGGQEAYGSMVQWAAQNLSVAEQEAYNKAVESGDQGQRDMAIAGLRARWQGTQSPSSPQLLGGDNSPHAGAPPFESKAQMTAAMNDPRYKTDPAFRQEVMNRLKHSSIF